MTAVAYVEVSRIAGYPTYAVVLIAAMLLGATAMARTGFRFGLLAGQTIPVAAIAIGAAFALAHVLDVAWYRWDDAMAKPRLWIQLTNGHSLFGAFAAVAIVVLVWTGARRLDRALYADLAAVGCAVALVIGRIACALVHDHPGTPTDLPIGVDYPADRAWFMTTAPGGPTVRVHDLGLYELVLLLPLVVAAFVLVRRRMRAGMTAAILAIAYAVLRFPLDFLRAPSMEPTRGGLTAGQWGSLALLALALLAARRISRTGHVAPLRDELAGRRPGMAASSLPEATVTS